MCLPAEHNFEAILLKKKMDAMCGTNGLGAVWIQGQMAKEQMAKFLLLSHQMFGR
jgi:hypothetical protein